MPSSNAEECRLRMERQLVTSRINTMCAQLAKCSVRIDEIDARLLAIKKERRRRRAA